MITFPEAPYDGQVVIDYVDEINVVIWTYDATDNSWRAQEFGPGQSMTTRTDMVYLTDQYGANPHPAISLKGIHIPDDLTLAKQKDLNEFIIYCLQEFDSIIGGLEVTGGALYDDNIRLRGQEGTQADLNHANKVATEATIIGLRSDVQWAENVAGVKLRGLWEHEGGANELGKGVEPGYFHLYGDASFSQPTRTQSFKEVQQVWVSVDSLGMGDYFRDSTEIQKGDLLTINETRTQAGGCYRITHHRVDWESEKQGDFHVFNCEPLEGAQFGTVTANSQCTFRVTPDSRLYADTRGATFKGHVVVEDALEVKKALTVDLKGGGMFFVVGQDDNYLLKTRGGTAVEYQGEVEKYNDLCNKGYVDEQISALTKRLAEVQEQLDQR